jgi:hypothetical protein
MHFLSSVLAQDHNKAFVMHIALDLLFLLTFRYLQYNLSKELKLMS